MVMTQHASESRRVFRWWRLVALLGLLVSSVGTALAAVPAAPNNIVVFPNRDFISVEGYEDRAGQTATLELTRPGVGIIGSAEAVVAAGGVAFEINHPGGVCWGNGTNLKITPDMQPGDIASIRFGNTPAGDVRVLDGYATSDAVQNGNIVTVTGHIGPGVNRDNTEQRIIEPDLGDTVIGKRDVRAIPGPLTASANGSYLSSLEFPTADTFLATYVFNDVDVATLVANASLGERLLSWEETDVVGNRQGITIAEFGEVGGPGFGGCPNGPLQAGPAGPTNVVAAKQGNGDIIVTWTPAVAIPGTPAITGYRVHAVAQTVTNNQQIEIGRRITGQSVSSTRITGLSISETYDIEIVSVSSVGETFPSIRAIVAVDSTPPVVTANSAGGSFAVPQAVTLSVDEAGADIYYTLDGTSPVDQGSTSLTAILYTGPISIAADTELQFAAFDPSNNISDVTVLNFVITNTPTPAAPTFGPATVGQGSISLNWSDVPADPSITEYTVTVYDGSQVGANVVAQQIIPAPASAATISGLTPELPYWVTIMAQNVNGYGSESARLGPLTPQGAVVANAGPDQTITRGTAAQVVQLSSAGSTTGVGVTYLWEQIGATAADTVVLSSGGAVANPTFTLPLYAFPQSNSPKVFRLTVTSGANVRTDTVSINMVTDSVVVTRATWRARDFRIEGTGTVNGATITIHSGSMSGPVIGRATVTAGVWTLRLRNAAAGPVSPGSIWIESNVGATLNQVPVN
jgi:Chitobiase/beta-hexosaminidase C-terminal domain/Fibronectin type III domain